MVISNAMVGVLDREFTEPHKFGYGVDYFGYQGPMMEFGNALERSQGQLGGKLTVEVIRDEQETEVVIMLPTRYGEFSPTYPYDCQKTDILLEKLYAYLLKMQKRH